MTNGDFAELFTQQTQWIADQIQLGGNPRNIQFVSHLGDVVSNAANITEWDRADASMAILDGVVPYSILPGNHDYSISSIKSSGTANYVDYFGPERFADAVWYGGADPSGNNSYQHFSAGGYDFLHLALEWSPTDNEPLRPISPTDWAQSILDANPDTPVILSTHEYVADFPVGRSAAGEDLWQSFVNRNDQIFMVLNGHFHSAAGANNGEYHQLSLNAAGRPVIEVLQNYQGYPLGGWGWLRLIDFDVANNKIRFETYSTFLDEFQTETVDDVGAFASQFEFDFDYAERLQAAILPGDYNDDGFVDSLDYAVWREHLGAEPDVLPNDNDYVVIGTSQFETWRDNYGVTSPRQIAVPLGLSAPEPSALTIVLCVSFGVLLLAKPISRS